MILGSYFWCYPVTSLVGGMAAERWGPRYVVLITSVLSGVLTIVTPAAARLHYLAVVVVRFLLGVAGVSTLQLSRH
jgi:ACS family sodium-dependent inorganic phosphate cotransporter